MSHMPGNPIGYKYLTKQGLLNLKNYKYSSGLAGWLDRTIMTPFWNATIEFFPMWMAPNLITAISLLHAVFATLLLTYYSPGILGHGPRPIYIIACACMFLYQTLDAIDGKQARRTGSATPLGQLFDHGCDAICAFLMAIFVPATVQFGPSIETMIVFFMHVIPFYVSNWEEACTGMMRFGLLGVTEGQFLVMSILAATGILGPEMWKWHVFGISIRHLLMLTGSTGCIYQCITSTKHVVEFINQGKIKADQAFYPAIQFVITMALGTAYALSPYDPLLFSQNPYVVLLIIGCVFGYQISRLIVFHVAGESYKRTFYILLPLPLLVLNAYTPLLLPSYRSKLGLAASTGSSHLLFNSQYAAYLYLAALVAQYAHFLIYVVQEICNGLNITCFTIKHSTSKNATINGSQTPTAAGQTPRRSARQAQN